MSGDNSKNIIDKILADANAEAMVITKEAEDVAAKIINEATLKAEKETEKLIATAKEEAQRAAAKEVSSAQMQAKKMILEQKQNLIADVISSAKEKILGLTEVEYKVIIKGMLENITLEPGSEIVFSGKDRSRFEKEFTSLGYRVSTEERDFEGGFVVKKGDIEYNYSFDSIISVEKENIEQVVAQILFG